MNRKGVIVTHLSFKNYLIFIGILVVLFFLYYFFILHSAGVISIKSICPENIIPDRMLLDGVEEGLPDCQRRVNEYGLERECMNVWADGTSIISMYCNKGNKEGENINYIYCNNLHYSNSPIDSKGNIGKTIYLTVGLVINPIDKTDEGYKVISSSCKD